VNEPATRNRSPLEDAGAMGMYLLIAALGMLFAGSVVGYLVTRAAHQPWPPPGFPVLPRSLWLSTLAIVLCSATVQRALSAVRRGDLPALRRRLAITLALGIAFLALQTFAWYQVVAQIDQPTENFGPYLKLFYVLTGLHAAHVLAGLATLAVVTRRAWTGRYTASDHRGVRYSAIYWHFLDAVWCVLFAIVYLM
jgi:cytochrome c oxidase subunit III